jgi:hypothetical protein
LRLSRDIQPRERPGQCCRLNRRATFETGVGNAAGDRFG